MHAHVSQVWQDLNVVGKQLSPNFGYVALEFAIAVLAEVASLHTLRGRDVRTEALIVLHV
jgi:hypothetical protein